MVFDVLYLEMAADTSRRLQLKCLPPALTLPIQLPSIAVLSLFKGGVAVESFSVVLIVDPSSLVVAITRPPSE